MAENCRSEIVVRDEYQAPKEAFSQLQSGFEEIEMNALTAPAQRRQNWVEYLGFKSDL